MTPETSQLIMRLKYKGKIHKLHIPKDCGKLKAVKDAIACKKSLTEIEALIKSWRRSVK